jgi:hypothetical protein
MSLLPDLPELGPVLNPANSSTFAFVVPVDNQSNIHPMFVMINQISIGKTNHGRTLYGRTTRHKDVRLCCIGAFLFIFDSGFFTGERQSYYRRTAQ